MLVASSLLSSTLSSSDVDVDGEVSSLSCEIGCESSTGGWRVVESCCLSASSNLGPPAAYINCDTLNNNKWLDHTLYVYNEARLTEIHTCTLYNQHSWWERSSHLNTTRWYMTGNSKVLNECVTQLT